MIAFNRARSDVVILIALWLAQPLKAVAVEGVANWKNGTTTGPVVPAFPR